VFHHFTYKLLLSRFPSKTLRADLAAMTLWYIATELWKRAVRILAEL